LKITNDICKSTSYIEECAHNICVKCKSRVSPVGAAGSCLVRKYTRINWSCGEAYETKSEDEKKKKKKLLA